MKFNNSNNGIDNNSDNNNNSNNDFHQICDKSWLNDKKGLYVLQRHIQDQGKTPFI